MNKEKTFSTKEKKTHTQNILVRELYWINQLGLSWACNGGAGGP